MLVMFSYNDGKLHDEIAVVGEFPKIELFRVKNTTQYVSCSSVINMYRYEMVSYSFQVDGQLMESRKIDNKQFQPKKYYWKEVPYIRVAPYSTRSVLILVIPGNPGLCDYYWEVVAALSRLVSNSEVVSVSCLGFDVEKHCSPERTFGLDDQVEHCSAFLSYLLEKHPQRPENIVILGHSVGAWTAQRVSMRHPEVGFVGLLTPTVKSIASSERGALLTKALRYFGPQSLYYTVKAVGMLPLSQHMLSMVISLMFPNGEVGSEARNASTKLAQNPHVCHQVLAMAAEEMERIGEEIEPEDIRGFWDRCRIWGCFAEDDHWVSQETREALMEYAKPRTNVRLNVASVPHAFCLRQSEAMAGLAARQIWQWMNPGETD